MRKPRISPTFRLPLRLVKAHWHGTVTHTCIPKHTLIFQMTLWSACPGTMYVHYRKTRWRIPFDEWQSLWYPLIIFNFFPSVKWCWYVIWNLSSMSDFLRTPYTILIWWNSLNRPNHKSSLVPENALVPSYNTLPEPILPMVFFDYCTNDVMFYHSIAIVHISLSLQSLLCVCLTIFLPWYWFMLDTSSGSYIHFIYHYQYSLQCTAVTSM